jgi:type I restriction enzyme M protein
MTQKELESYLWSAAILLRGYIDAGDYKQYIFPLLFFKRISDVYDEEFEKALIDSGNDLDFAEFAENHRFQIPSGSHWKDIREVSVNVGSALALAMQSIEKANQSILYGIFGDASWTNKDRLSDETLINLIEHFSSKTLTIANVPDDMLGDGYEYLIKKFADDSGHTAAEFYTNRTVVELMTLMMDPKVGESVYDPTCGSGGLLLNCALQLKNQNKEYRSLKLYGQEINLTTSSIARMNMFMHGIEDFEILRGDTLSSPMLLEKDKLKTFNVILANPPYSIKRWDRNKFENDPYGRNIFGTPPQGTADYAFQQHIIKSLDARNGRSIVLWPHGILFRDSEKLIRKKLIESDLIEAVIGLGPNLFYNSPMESCLLVCRTNKPIERKGKVIFINAVEELKLSSTVSMLEPKHIKKIYETYRDYSETDHFSIIVNNQIILDDHDSNLNIPLYVQPLSQKTSLNNITELSIEHQLKDWKSQSDELDTKVNNILEELR